MLPGFLQRLRIIMQACIDQTLTQKQCALRMVQAQIDMVVELEQHITVEFQDIMVRQ